jgi:hypothetical protein
MVMAIFVLFLVTNLGIALLFLSRNEVQFSQADGRSKRVFYLAEAGLEDARRTLFLTNGEGSFNDDLDTAAGADDAISLDVTALQANFDGAGNLTGFSGVGDDVPLAAITSLGDGVYAAYLTNDPVEGRGALVDNNNRVMLTGIGVGPDRSMEVVQAIIQPRRPFPLTPQAAITLLGPTPNFDSGSSNPSKFEGNDCGQGGGLFVPTVGTMSRNAELSVESGMFAPNGPDFRSGSFTGADTVVDLTDTTDTLMVDSGMNEPPPEWQDCDKMRDAVLELESRAHHTSLQGAYNPDDITFIDGDVQLNPPDSGRGILVVTGTLTIDGNVDWDGLILVVGEGHVLRDGGGSGNLSGAIVVADVAGPDGIFGNSDDCQNGFEIPDFVVNGNGNSNVEYCSTAILNANPLKTYKIEEFIQL